MSRCVCANMFEHVCLCGCALVCFCVCAHVFVCVCLCLLCTSYKRCGIWDRGTGMGGHQIRLLSAFFCGLFLFASAFLWSLAAFFSVFFAVFLSVALFCFRSLLPSLCLCIVIWACVFGAQLWFFHRSFDHFFRCSLFLSASLAWVLCFFGHFVFLFSCALCLSLWLPWGSLIWWPPIPVPLSYIPHLL